MTTQVGIYGSALQAASFHGQERIVSLLLEHGADVNTQSRIYRSALQGRHVVAMLSFGHCSTMEQT
jgi:ankyrin repeat protein